MTLQQISQYLDRINSCIGKAAAWLMLPLVFLMVVVVILRYFFGTGWVALQEAIVYLHAFAFMLALAWTLHADQHVRVDIFYRSFSQRRKALVNLLGSLVFLLPISLLILVNGLDYAAKSWQVLEGSREAGGLPFLFLLKSVIPFTALMLLLQGVSIVLQSIVTLREQR